MNRNTKMAVMTVAITALLAGRAVATEYSVYGYLFTSTGSDSGCNLPVGNIKVDMWDEDYGPDDYCGTDYSSPGYGTFQVNFSDSFESPDVYIEVEYKFKGPDNHFVNVQVQGSGTNIIDHQPGGVHNDIPAGSNNLGNINLSTNRANIGTQSTKCLWWTKTTAGSWWSLSSDLLAETAATAGCYCTGNAIYIDQSTCDNANLFSDVHHETGHSLHYNARGGSFPPGGGYDHYVYTQITEGQAISEGWAEWVAYLSAPADSKNQLSAYGNNPPTWWRGQARYLGGNNPPPAYTENTGTDNAGDIVEGAIWRTWMSIDGDFSVAFHALDTSNAGHFKQWLDDYATAKSWNINGLLAEAQANGIIYTRAKITTFTQGAPPNDAPASNGNFRVIDNIAFLRGTVNPTFAQLTRAELNLSPSSSIVTAGSKDLGYKVAVAGLDEAYNAGDWTWTAAVNWAAALNFATAGLSDGAYDLLAGAENGHSYWDLFSPDFAGDAVANRASTERWLKSRQTWYNQDTDPDNDAEGEVMLDNKAPVVDDNSRKPAPN